MNANYKFGSKIGVTVCAACLYGGYYIQGVCKLHRI